MARRLYLFAGGGTGGHLFPGIAVAECLLEREPGARILFVGSDRDIEREILRSTPFEHRALPTVTFAGSWRHPLRFLGEYLAARRAARRLIDAEQPDLVIGCGGFASAAPVFAAHDRWIPFLLLEQNIIPGRATRWLSRLGGTACLSFEEAAKRLPKSAESIVTGNPVRKSIARLKRMPDQRSLLIIGGSQGAESINTLMAGVVTRNPGLFAGWRVIHQTGPTGESRAQRVYEQFRVNATASAFFEDMTSLYGQASLVISRAGATTLAELACAGLPVILIPYPHARDDHQRRNAEWYEAHGAAVVVDEKNRTTRHGQQFHELLRDILQDDQRREDMSAAMAKLARPEAASNVVNVIQQRCGEPG